MKLPLYRVQDAQDAQDADELHELHELHRHESEIEAGRMRKRSHEPTNALQRAPWRKGEGIYSGTVKRDVRTES